MTKILFAAPFAIALAFACTGGTATTGTATTGTTTGGTTSSGGGGGACATRPGNHIDIDSSTGTKAMVDAVMPPTLVSGTALNTSFCGAADTHDFWWKMPGAHAMGATFTLTVTFARAGDANDVDFEVVYFQADGTGTSSIASCTAGSGSNESCNGTLDEATTDVYVRGYIGSATTAEDITITLTKS